MGEYQRSGSDRNGRRGGFSGNRFHGNGRGNSGANRGGARGHFDRNGKREDHLYGKREDHSYGKRSGSYGQRPDRFKRDDNRRSGFRRSEDGGKRYSRDGQHSRDNQRHEGYFKRGRESNPFTSRNKYEHEDDRRGMNRSHRDGQNRRFGARHDQDERGNRRFGGGNRRYSDRGGFDRTGDRDDRKRFDRRGNERFARDHRRREERDNRGFEKRDNDRHFDRHFDRRSDHGFDRRDDYRDDRRNDSHEASRLERGSRQGRADYGNKVRRNSDGTLSFPSQNPYTARRPGEPKMPAGLEYDMLSKEDRLRLRGLSKEHSENIGLHILAAYLLEGDDPTRALAHAKWVARQASRVDIARETLAFVAYRTGDYKLAAREFRTAYRMNGYVDYLPFIADCERGMGRPERAIEVALSDDAKRLTGDSKAEMMLVFAGAYADQGKWDQALKVVRTLQKVRGLDGGYRLRAVQAEQNFLEQAGRADEAQKLELAVEALEDEFADSDDDDQSDDEVVDNDLEYADDAMLENLGIDLSEFVEDEADESDGSDESSESNGAVAAESSETSKTDEAAEPVKSAETTSEQE